MICIFRQESKKREQNGLSLVTEKIDVKKAEWEETMNGYQRII